MEEERSEQEQPLTFNGIEVNPRSKKQAGSLADAILGRESEEELAEALESQGFGTDEISKLNNVLSPRKGEKDEAIDKRKEAIRKLQGAHAHMKGLPEDKREWGDTFQRESGRGSFKGSRKLTDIDRADKKEN